MGGFFISDQVNIMRLTNTIREAFVRSVMNDVPSIDYEEKIRNLVNKKVVAIHKKVGIQGIDKERLSGAYLYIRGTERKGFGATSCYVNGLTENDLKEIQSDSALIALADLKYAQDESRNALRKKIDYAIKACSTRKQAVEALPEFEKYLPEDEAKTIRAVPAIANVLSDFVKAGWPKGQKKSVTPTATTNQ